MLNPEEKKTLEYFIANEGKYSYHSKVKPKAKYSTVVISRNRCPYTLNESAKNPLIWCIDSIMNQEILPEELILINDCSDDKPIDYTQEMVKLIEGKCEGKDVKFVYIFNEERKNAAIARNQGAQIAKNDIIHFVDDDCILRSTTSKGVLLFNYVLENDKNCFMLDLPQNTRTSHPTALCEAAGMGKIEKDSLDLTSNLTNCFPKEYLDDAPREQYESQTVFKPIVMQNFQGGNILVSKEKLLAIGGFPDYRSPISYGEETGLAIRAIKAGYSIYYFPYVNLASVHLTYGNASGRTEFDGSDWLDGQTGLNLKEMVEESVKERFNTGMRVPRELYFYVKIRNFAILLEELKSGLGFVDWKRKSFTDFVEKDDIKFQDRKGSVESKSIREKIWNLAIAHAEKNDSFSSEKLLEYIKE